jgi:hypothetical protein
MKKRDKIIYWIATVWLALGMTSTGIIQLLQIEEATANFENLGYPTYIMPFLGVLKILGVIVILVPKRTLLKEWAYAGFLFLMVGAIFSHLSNDDELSTIFGPTLLVLLTVTSWYFRLPSRKLMLTNNHKL